jgi:COMPASS component BRE2
MSNKKRKLSPTLSSRSSPTPGPSSGTIPATASSPPADNLPLIATPASRAGSASVSGDATPVPYSQHNLSVAGRSEMKMPTVTPGSGDGVGYGDECFIWQDLPNQSGE